MVSPLRDGRGIGMEKSAGRHGVGYPSMGPVEGRLAPLPPRVHLRSALEKKRHDVSLRRHGGLRKSGFTQDVQVRR